MVGNIWILRSRSACFAVIGGHVIRRIVANSLDTLNAGTQIGLNYKLNLVPCVQFYGERIITRSLRLFWVNMF